MSRCGPAGQKGANNDNESKKQHLRFRPLFVRVSVPFDLFNVNEEKTEKDFSRQLTTYAYIYMFKLKYSWTGSKCQKQ